MVALPAGNVIPSTNGVWGYPTVIDSCPDIRDYVALYWNRVDGVALESMLTLWTP